MLFEKKAPVTLEPTRSFKKELDYLYARRSAIDGLIQSLEDYTRFRADKMTRQDKRRTA
ncbi:MAG TPA: hypothetical protein VE959_33985 [Bryobacteraceae bacterium]|nr:hypothetical protein [Bryobacteraceae bacterium]